MNAQVGRPVAQTAAVKVLVVDDDPLILKVWRVILRSDEFEVTVCANGQEALQALAASKIDVVVTDVMMPGIDGMELLRRVKQARPEIEVIVMTAKASIQDAVKAMREGAFDYLTKPFVEIEECVNRVRQAARLKRLHDENQALRDQVDASPTGALVDSVAPSMKAVMSLVNQVAKVNSNVLITGPTGTGKSAIARSIHDRSPRKDAPFVHVDCGVLTKEFMVSELYGHAPGAYTGARSGAKEGLFQAANGGTIFLDELGELSLELQPKLLRVLETREVRRVGGTRPLKVDVRVIAATNRRLEDEVKAGRFREDLFYRLSVVRVFLPALRDRREDIPLLVKHFLKEGAFNRDASGGLRVRNIARDALDLLTAHEWPGNIRELLNAIERACSFAERDCIEVADLPTNIAARAGVVAKPTLPATLPAPLPVPSAAPAPASPEFGESEPGTFKEAKEQWVAAFEREYVLNILRRNGFNISHAAREAEIDRKYFRKLMRKYGIDAGHDADPGDDDL